MPVQILMSDSITPQKHCQKSDVILNELTLNGMIHTRGSAFQCSRDRFENYQITE